MLCSLCRTFLAVTLLVLAVRPLRAQPILPLAANELVTRTLVRGSVESFALNLEAGLFVYGEVDQRTVDVVLSITGPDGTPVDQFDTSSRGVESFHFETTAPGLHHITVQGFDGEVGAFAIRVDRVEPVANTLEGRLDQIAAPYTGNDRPGMVAVFVEKGEVVLTRSYGMANLEWGVPNGLDVKYQIGSTSKQFTAFAVTLLAEGAQLDLDADVRTYLPELPELGETVTVRHLLTHTSGYRDMMDLELMADRQPEDQFDQVESIATLRRQQTLQFSPGSTYRYNNTGYHLLALIVERVTGAPFHEWLRANVFAPAGMHDTAIRWGRGTIVGRGAEGYIPEPNGGYRQGVQNSATYGASNVYTTPLDLARWMANLRSGAVGGKAVIDAMTTRNVLSAGDTSFYGFGLRIDRDMGLRRIQHSGGAMAFRAWFAHYPEIDAGFILLSNSSAFERGVIDRVARTFIGTRARIPKLETVRRPKSTSETPISGTSELREPWNPDMVELQQFSGTYFSEELESYYRLTVVDGALVAVHRRLGALPLHATAPDEFSAAFPFTDLRMTRTSDGSVSGFVVSSARNHNVVFLKQANTRRR